VDDFTKNLLQVMCDYPDWSITFKYKQKQGEYFLYIENRSYPKERRPSVLHWISRRTLESSQNPSRFLAYCLELAARKMENLETTIRDTA
jgi:hypothetical protein